MRYLFLALVAVGATACTSEEPPRPETALLAVVRVLDGDSIVVADGDQEIEVRLLGVNTPERDECYDERARDATEGLLGDSVRLSGSEKDRFGRVLAYVYTDEATLVNRELVAAGAALALSTEHRMRDEFAQAETVAYEAGLGRWQPDACGERSPGKAEISALEPDAPGDDSRNRNGEWIEVTNTGAADLNLGGWMIQDQSSQHRFEFPSGYQLEPGATARILSGEGTDEPGRLYWDAADPVWSNGGDTAYLLDAVGNVRDRRSV